MKGIVKSSSFKAWVTQLEVHVLSIISSNSFEPLALAVATKCFKKKTYSNRSLSLSSSLLFSFFFLLKKYICWQYILNSVKVFSVFLFCFSCIYSKQAFDLELLFTTIQVKPFRFKSSQSYIISVQKISQKEPGTLQWMLF